MDADTDAGDRPGTPDIADPHRPCECGHARNYHATGDDDLISGHYCEYEGCECMDFIPSGEDPVNELADWMQLTFLDDPDLRRDWSPVGIENFHRIVAILRGNEWPEQEQITAADPDGGQCPGQSVPVADSTSPLASSRKKNEETSAVTGQSARPVGCERPASDVEPATVDTTEDDLPPVPGQCPWDLPFDSICPKHGGPLTECPVKKQSPFSGLIGGTYEAGTGPVTLEKIEMPNELWNWDDRKLGDKS